MGKQQVQQFDATQPALIVTYGNTVKKRRSLDKDILVLGRNPGCDFSLVSPEVAPIHCVLAHVGDGWHLRDCSGRPGTRVNGQMIQEVLLRDGDIIQIGAFSFEAQLPSLHGPQNAVKNLSQSRLRTGRVVQSRRNLLRLALKLRKRLGNRARLKLLDAELAIRQAELNEQVEALQQREKEFQLRMTRLELAERDLTTDRATLEKEYKDLQDEAQRTRDEAVLLQDRARQLDERSRELDARAHQLKELEQEPGRKKSAPAEARTSTGSSSNGNATGSHTRQQVFLARMQETFQHQQEELGRLIDEMRNVLEGGLLKK